MTIIKKWFGQKYYEVVKPVGRLPIILCVIDADDGSLERSYIYSGAQPMILSTYEKTKGSYP